MARLTGNSRKPRGNRWLTSPKSISFRVGGIFSGLSGLFPLHNQKWCEIGGQASIRILRILRQNCGYYRVLYPRGRILIKQLYPHHVSMDTLDPCVTRAHPCLASGKLGRWLLLQLSLRLDGVPTAVYIEERGSPTAWRQGPTHEILTLRWG